MTFGNLILSLRERLNDLRKPDASLVTLATEDGIRWTSSKLMAIINAAINEATRMLVVYSESPILHAIVSGGGLIRQSNIITLTDGVVVLPSYIATPIEVKVDDDNFSPISSTKYFLYLTDDSQPRNEGNFFTVLFDVSDNLRKLYFLPTNTAGSMVVTYVETGANYTVDNLEADIFPVGVDDFILDIAEREAREREHSWDRAQVLDMRIAIKLGIKQRG